MDMMTTTETRRFSKRLTARQQELLQLVEVHDNRAVFGSEERIPDWKALKVVLESLGSKWARGSKKIPGGFVFPEDVDGAQVVRIAQKTGEIFDWDAAGMFETPVQLAERMAQLACIPMRGSHFLEPSAGRGRIALALQRVYPANITCVELLAPNVSHLRAAGFATVQADFLQCTIGLENPRYDLAGGRQFDAIVMNPPFAKRADIHHITHALQFLRPGGRLVAVASIGVQERQDRLSTDFRAKLYGTCHNVSIVENDEGTFKESGTMVRTVLISATNGDGR